MGWAQRRVEVGRTGTTVVTRPGRGGITLVLCHSLALDHRVWDELLEELPSELDVLAYDVRNHGSAARMPEFTLADCADDLVEILDDYQLDRVHLAGLSMGGAIAQEFALRHEDRLAGLTLMGTAGRAPGSMIDRAEAAARDGLGAQVAGTLARWFSPDYLAADGPWVAYARDRIASWDERSWYLAWLAMGDRDVLARLAGVEVPALCLAGGDDVSAPPAALQALAEALFHSTLQVVPGPHLFPIEAPRETAAAILQQHSRLSESKTENRE